MNDIGAFRHREYTFEKAARNARVLLSGGSLVAGMRDLGFPAPIVTDNAEDFV